MRGETKVYKKNNLKAIAQRLRDDLSEQNKTNLVLLYAYNRTGKTRLSMEYKNLGKKKNAKDTLYFNAFTEDLFSWHNDLENDSERFLKINSHSKFFKGFKELALDERIQKFFYRYTDIKMYIDYENWRVYFSHAELKDYYEKQSDGTRQKRKKEIWVENIKISRGEENIFIWSIFLVLCELVVDGDISYNWVKYLYIDDPISSLDDNNAIMIAVDLMQLLKKRPDIKAIVSSPHSLFFNVICNESRNINHKKYFFTYSKTERKYFIQNTTDTPLYHHIVVLHELREAIEKDKTCPYHFNMLRRVFEKTACFFGQEDFGVCVSGVDNETLYTRALNLLSHESYSLFNPSIMQPENRVLLKNIFNNFIEKYPLFGISKVD